MLSYIGWINGLTAVGVLICGCTFGFYFIYQSKKNKAKLLLYLGLAAIFAGLGQLGPVLDLLTILTTNQNLTGPHGLIPTLSFIWLAPCILFAMYLGAELMMSKKKNYILVIFIVLSIFFELFIFLDPISSFTINYPENPGEDLVDDSLNFGSIPGIITIIFIISALIFLGFGFLQKAIQSTGIIRKQFLFLSIGMFLYIIFAALDGLTTPGIALVFVRIPEITSFWFMYFGLKEKR